ncbi:Oidioi.mRNA.OKI2018_I69.PAR.g10580.t1.cds [Oikopleura dioica]|uniref:Oidioi.mRNA.OKI2018_I69.PAR.g10580.t1.cds n=1 Tax=Oikopleura dioica TaxID=34765 RepID=A0ABN7RWJ2_OIKDI|nr:Oidioi.mRNA.OKI2018_I69.PAR.g10580.t1.cds [Oikopleura dioica]
MKLNRLKVCTFVSAARPGYVAPSIIQSHRSVRQNPTAEALTDPSQPEIEEAAAPDFFAPFIFGCVVLAGLTGIIVGLCLRIEAIRRCECVSDMTSCIAISEDLEFPEKEISPYKEPLKKKGGSHSNPYPNFKVPEGLPGGLIMVSDSPRLNRKNSLRSLSRHSLSQIGRKVGPRDIFRQNSITGSFGAKSLGSKKSANLSFKRKSIADGDNTSIHSSRSNGTLRSKDGNWLSHSCQQANYNRVNQYLAQQKNSVTPGKAHASPLSIRKASTDKVVLSPYETIVVRPQSTFQKQATVNEAIVY